MEPGRHPLVLFALAAVALVMAIAWLAPASLLDARLARATGGIVRLASTQGTLWDGRGVVTAANARIPIAWSVDAWPLVRGVVHMRVRSDTGADKPRATVDLGTDGIVLQNTHVTVPAAAIAGVLGDQAASSVDGEVDASLSNLRLAAGANSGEARLVWHNARIRAFGSANPLELGEVRAGFVANGATMSGPIDAQGGNVALRGDWTLNEKDAFTVALRMTLKATADAGLVRWLSTVGHPDGDGWRIDWRLPLR
jgi:type II secretion system (T2SS) protein N